MKKLTFALAFATALTACKADNPAVTAIKADPPPAIERGTVTQYGPGVQVDYDSRVDILFVIDDSKSMKAHQTNLSQNIKSFVEELAKVKAIDFHIGYTVAHDRGRYGITPEGRTSPLVPEIGCDGTPNWEPVGSLRPLKGPADKLPKDGRRFVTREDDFATILKDSLDPTVNTSLSKNLVNTINKEEPCGYGPEEEELFSPVLGLLEDPTRAAGPNQGFRRDGAFFVVIIVSDAKSADVNYGLTPEVVMLRIAAATGQVMSDKKRFRVLSVAMKPGTKINVPGCMADPAFNRIGEVGTHADVRYVQEDENPLVTLAQLTQDQETSSVDQVLSICDSNYGDDLAKYGAQVKQDTLRDVELMLPSLPQAFFEPEKKDLNLQVLIGEQPLSRDLWKYSSQNGNNQGGVVTVFGQKVPWDKYPNAKISVRYVPVDAAADTTKPVSLQ